jgi:glycogen debranching enzyme
MADYYQGAIWPWTIYLYVESFTRLFQDAKEEAKELYNYFQPVLSLTDEGLIGYLPETISEDPDIAQSGISDYTPAAAGILWSFFKLIVKMRS